MELTKRTHLQGPKYVLQLAKDCENRRLALYMGVDRPMEALKPAWSGSCLFNLWAAIV